jgi:hypothetical protein
VVKLRGHGINLALDNFTHVIFGELAAVQGFFYDLGQRGACLSAESLGSREFAAYQDFFKIFAKLPVTLFDGSEVDKTLDDDIGGKKAANKDWNHEDSA